MSTDPLALVRADLRDFAGYRSARSEMRAGRVWLNANESPWPSPAESEPAPPACADIDTDTDAAIPSSLRRYPDPQPPALRAALARLYGCEPGQLLAGRGSDEAIDLLVRSLCPPGRGPALVPPPTFGLYAVSARLHGTQVIEVPLRDAAGDGQGFACDFDAVAAMACESGAKLVFLCSPGNPSGTLLPLAAIEALAARLDGKALVVVDEAYLDYAGAPSAVTLLARRRNVAVLRTLSKAHALAAARIGCVIADADLIAVLQRCQPPYPLPAPSVDRAIAALSPAACRQTAARVAEVVHLRGPLQAALAAMPGVRRVYPSAGNFVLARFDDAQAVFDRLIQAGIVVRDMRAAPGLGDALRITVGTAEQNASVLAVLTGVAA